MSEIRVNGATGLTTHEGWTASAARETLPPAPQGSIAYVGPEGTPPLDLGTGRLVDWLASLVASRRRPVEARAPKAAYRPAVDCC